MPANRQKTGFRGPSPDVGKATQFKPGQSGNPGGRPKRKIISEALKDELADCVRRGDETGAMAIAKAMVEKACRGDVPAATFVRDTTEGKPVQAVRVEAEMDEATARRLFDLAERLLGEAPLATPPPFKPQGAGTKFGTPGESARLQTGPGCLTKEITLKRWQPF